MNGEKAILFATDPPYLVDYDGTNHPSKQGEADKNKDWGNSYGITWDDSSQGPELYEGFIKAAIEHAILPNAAWYCWHASRRQAMVEGVWEKYGAFVHQQIIWAKDRGILTRSYYLWKHEPCFIGWLKGNKPPRVVRRLSEHGVDRCRRSRWARRPTTRRRSRSISSPSRCASTWSRAGSATSRSPARARRSWPARRRAGGSSRSRSARSTSTSRCKRWQTATGKQAMLDGDGRTFDEVAGERLPKAA